MEGAFLCGSDSHGEGAFVCQSDQHLTGTFMCGSYSCVEGANVHTRESHTAHIHGN